MLKNRKCINVHCVLQICTLSVVLHCHTVQCILFFVCLSSVKFVIDVVNKGVKQLANIAKLWYVPVSQADLKTVVRVPPMPYTSDEQEAHGRDLYQRLKVARANVAPDNGSKR